MTKDEKRHLQRVADLGCIVCRNVYFRKTAAEIHHIRAGQGMAQRASHFETIPLCPRHHRTGGYGVAIHAGQAARVVILGYYKNKPNELRAAHAEGVMRTLVILEKEGLVKAG